MRVPIVLSLSMLAVACLGPQRAAQGSKAEQLAWLDALDARYESSCAPDTGEAERARAAFFGDPEISRRLSELSGASDPEVARRASAWGRFIGRARLLSSPEVRKANGEILAAVGGEGTPGALGLMGDLFKSKDGEVRWAALARIAARSRAVLPLIRSRAQALDAQARAMGAKDGLSYLAGADAKARVERVCREQVERTAGDWQQALEIVQRRVIGRPTVADFGAEVIAEGQDAGAFFLAERLPELSRSALARMGFGEVRPRGDFSEGGFASARGYFRELGRAVYLERVRAARLPGCALSGDCGLREGVAEIFAMIPRDLPWLRAQFPEVSTVDLERFERSTKALDALAIRFRCLTARLEVEAAVGGDVEKSWGPMYEETFGTIPPVGPAWILLHPAYLSAPFSLIGAVDSTEVRDAFLRRLGATPLLSLEGGRQLDEVLLAPGPEKGMDPWGR